MQVQNRFGQCLASTPGGIALPSGNDMFSDFAVSRSAPIWISLDRLCSENGVVSPSVRFW